MTVDQLLEILKTLDGTMEVQVRYEGADNIVDGVEVRIREKKVIIT